MLSNLSLVQVAFCAAVVLTSYGLAQADCPHCCDQVAAEHRCVMKEVKTPIKKVVYECKQVPFCVHKVPRLGEHGCVCAQCEACPRYKTVLIKKEIVIGHKCELKCVVEEVAKTPCAHCQSASDAQKVADLEAPLPVDVAPLTR